MNLKKQQQQTSAQKWTRTTENETKERPREQREKTLTTHRETRVRKAGAWKQDVGHTVSQIPTPSENPSEVKAKQRCSQAKGHPGNRHQQTCRETGVHGVSSDRMKTSEGNAEPWE